MRVDQSHADRGKPKASADTRRLLYLFNKSSNNMNQLAHRANADHLAGTLSESTYEGILYNLEQVARYLKTARLIMLIRISGGIQGIKEYLENGQKQGRDFSRDELDERVILAGDLEATDAVIQRMDNDGEKYLHVTIAFKDEMNRPRNTGGRCA
jgi:hypothetical protein